MGFNSGFKGLSGGYKNLHYLTQFIVTVQHFTFIKNNKIYLKKSYVVLPVCN